MRISLKIVVDDTRLDKTTGELRTPRHETDGHLHFQGDGNLAYGIKFVLVATVAGPVCFTVGYVLTPLPGISKVL